MPLLEEELVNFGFKGWLGIFGTANRYTAPDNSAWYEEPYSLDISVRSSMLWLEDSSIPVASTTSDAHAAALAHPTIIQEYDNSTAIHLTPTINQKAFVANAVYGDWSTRLRNWIMPQLIANPTTGDASWGYAIRFWNGDPNSGGTEILTSMGQAPGTSRVGWFTHYGSGIIEVASDFDFSGLGIDPTDLWITGYRYIGDTATSLVTPDEIVEDVVTSATIGSPVEIGSPGVSGGTVVATLTDSSTGSPIFGIVKSAGKVITLGHMSGLTIQNYTIGSIGKPCFVNASGQLDANRTYSSGHYIKIVGKIISSTEIYVSPSNSLIEVG